MKTVLGLSLCITLLTLVSCAHSKKKDVTKNDCMAMNWQVLGENHGRLGESSIEEYVNLCSKHKVYVSRVDRDNYRTGFQTGLKSFCTYENGKLLAMEGKELKRVCSGRLGQDILKGFNAGKKELASKK